jgi:para-nitrobenzyl esterase
MYVWTSEDRKVSATMSAYFANFIKTGNPNGKGLGVWPKGSLDPAKIRRQVIDVRTYSAPFPEQRRYEAVEALLP